MPYTQTNCQVCTLETVGESTVACTAVSISCLGQSHLIVQQFQFQFDQFLGLPVCLLCICPTTKARQISLQEKKQLKNDADDYDGL